MPPCAPGSARKKGEGADERTPRCSERERERVSADRRAPPRSEREKRGRARGLTAPLGRARASRARGGTLGRHGPKPGVGAGFRPARVWGWARFGEGKK
jgi:hypothetical protein